MELIQIASSVVGSAVLLMIYFIIFCSKKRNAQRDQKLPQFAHSYCEPKDVVLKSDVGHVENRTNYTEYSDPMDAVKPTANREPIEMDEYDTVLLTATRQDNKQYTGNSYDHVVIANLAKGRKMSQNDIYDTTTQNLVTISLTDNIG